MKKLKFIAFLLIGTVVFSSCEDFLNPAPIDAIGSEGFYTTTEEVDAGVVAIYDGLQEIPNMEYALTEMRSDNAKTRTSEGEWAQFENMSVEPTNGGLSDFWSNTYNVIFRANTVLPHLDVVTETAKKDQFEGEIRFARALMYFNLVRLWGEVPLVDKVIGPEETEYFSRNSVSELYSFIVSDLLAASEKLPLQSEMAFGRATKGAAQTLLAKVYLTQGKYTEAKTLLTEVIGSTEYALETDYSDIFFSDKSKEIIFGNEYIQGDENNSQAFSYAFSPQGRSGGLNWPTDDLFAAMDTSIDARTSTLFFWNSAAGSSGDWACGKYVNDGNIEPAGNPWIFLRYADVYLMYCEAVLGGASSTTDTQALIYINEIRTRANLVDLTEITSENLLLERRIEFAFENHRFFDLLRFDKADATMSAFALTAEGGFVFKSTALLLPIPQREINIYPEMGQNDGY